LRWSSRAQKSRSDPVLVIDDSISFDLDKPIRIDEADDLHDGVRRPDVAEELAMDGGHGFPILDAGEKDARPNNVTE
jgi:hypothetical protein